MKKRRSWGRSVAHQLGRSNECRQGRFVWWNSFAWISVSGVVVWVERRRWQGSWVGRSSSGRGRELRDRVRVWVSVVWGEEWSRREQLGTPSKVWWLEERTRRSSEDFLEVASFWWIIYVCNVHPFFVFPLLSSSSIPVRLCCVWWHRGWRAGQGCKTPITTPFLLRVGTCVSKLPAVVVYWTAGRLLMNAATFSWWIVC